MLAVLGYSFAFASKISVGAGRTVGGNDFERIRVSGCLLDLPKNIHQFRVNFLSLDVSTVCKKAAQFFHRLEQVLAVLEVGYFEVLACMRVEEFQCPGIVRFHGIHGWKQQK